MKRSGSNMFLFLDEVGTIVVRIPSVWSTYSTVGGSTLTSWATAKKNTQVSPSK